MQIALLSLSPTSKTEKEQKKLFSGAGFHGPFVHNRDDAVKELQKGDTLLVASAASFASSSTDALKALIQIQERGASLYVIDIERHISVPKSAIQTMQFAIDLGSEAKANIVKNKTQEVFESGQTHSHYAWNEEKQRLLETMLAEKQLSRAQMAKALSVSVSTLQRKIRLQKGG